MLVSIFLSFKNDAARWPFKDFTKFLNRNLFTISNTLPHIHLLQIYKLNLSVP